MMAKNKKNRLLKHLKSIGFTNRLSLYSLAFLMASIILGFILAVMSIQHETNFALAAYTCSVAPIGTFVSIAIGKSIDKSKSENTSGGVKYELAMANLVDYHTEPIDDDSIPTI